MAGDTHYEVLGVAHDTPAPEVRKAYLRMARRYHPDFHASADEQSRIAAELMMRDINAAWEVLGNFRTRERYDRKLREAGAAPVATANKPAPATSTKVKKAKDKKQVQRARRPAAEPSPSGPPQVGAEEGSGIVLPGWMTLAPAAFLALALSSFIVGTVVKLAALFIAGLAFAILGAAMFIVAPAVALKRAKQG